MDSHQNLEQSPPPFAPSAPPLPTSLYPSFDLSDLNEDLFPESAAASESQSKHPPSEETLLRVPGAFLHLIDKHRSVELASGELSVVGLRQGDNFVAVLVRVGDSDEAVQWPLARDAAAVKLDESHYFFSLHVPDEEGGHGAGSPDVLSYGLTFASKGQESLLKELDGILETYSSFSVQKVSGKEPAEALDGSVAGEVTPAEVMEEGSKREMMEERSAAYWTTLAPNVEDYSGLVAKAIAAGSGQLVRGILWCGEVTVERLKWGNDMLKKRMGPNGKPTDISPETLARIKRVRKFTKMSEKVATGVLCGVVKVSGYVTSSVVNSRAGKKFFGLLPGEVVLASLDGFGKICDAFEMAGKNVLSTSSVVTTGLVSHRYGEKAAEAASQGLDAAGHAVGTAWAVFKIGKAIDPKSTIKPHTLCKSGAEAIAAEFKATQGK
ncbi:protein EARLY-RESPONSIVE TO DEHYDRATION 7, chloroplastic-like [Canna indica]|uniref:Protein EARLY-RESPONSIVE TO DEHYDRATION 7, chloroplastic-like n=1 Tax=Canna indica TaxID=4628 RepID=A0AAQ3KS96_9LILI|nr:protein EARLY-RESPONSIVE TO DEHYDRATION 7, chloroplastic-like [Canna indica]